MRRVAIKSAAGCFFLVAGAAWVGGADPLTCGLRALIGAATIYVLVTTAGGIVVDMMVRTIMKGPESPAGKAGTAGERENRPND